MSNLSFQQIQTNGVRLNVAVAGPEEGPLLILLHGFPEFWIAWERYIPIFADAGFRVMAPDQRGYHLSEKPPHAESYASHLLVADVLGLIDSTGRKKATVVGHDWGAFVTWGLMMLHPDRVEKAVVMDVPHPKVMGRHLKSNPKQMLRSWYIAFFLLPRLPELLLAVNGRRLMRSILTGTALPGTFSEEQLDRYDRAWAQQGAITSMLNWYRAGRRRSRVRSGSKKEKIQVPVLILWGKRDSALGYEMAEESSAWCENARVEILEDATHWLHHEKPETVQKLVLQFIQSEMS